MPKKKIKIDLTNFYGETKSISFHDIENAKAFVKVYPTKIAKNQRIKIKCDALAIDGWVSGTL
jgi:purine nucleoside permease